MVELVDALLKLTMSCDLNVLHDNKRAIQRYGIRLVGNKGKILITL